MVSFQDCFNNVSSLLSGAQNRNFFQCRYIVAMMGFLTYIILNIQIISTSVSIVAMVNNSALQSQALSNNGTVACVMNIANTTKDTYRKVRISVIRTKYDLFKILNIRTEYSLRLTLFLSRTCLI